MAVPECGGSAAAPARAAIASKSRSRASAACCSRGWRLRTHGSGWECGGLLREARGRCTHCTTHLTSDMSGTWLQSGTYGPHPGHNGPPAAGLTAEALLQALRSLPAVALARKSKCEWGVATTLFAHKPAQLRPPASHPTTAPPHCWLAFVDTLEHHTPGWTAVKLALFPSCRTVAALTAHASHLTPSTSSSGSNATQLQASARA